REALAAIGRTRKGQFLAAQVAIAAGAVVVIGPDHVYRPTPRTAGLVNCDPGLIAEGLAGGIVKNADRSIEGSAAIMRGQHGDATLVAVGHTRRVENQRVDVVVQTKGKGDV